MRPNSKTMRCVWLFFLTLLLVSCSRQRRVVNVFIDNNSSLPGSGTPITPGGPTVPIDPGNPGNPGVPTNPGGPGNPGNPGGPGNPTDPNKPPPDFEIREEQFFFDIPNGKLSLLFIVDDSETMEAILPDVVIHSAQFEQEFTKEDLSRLQYKIGFITSSSSQLRTVQEKSLLKEKTDLSLIPTFFESIGFGGPPDLYPFAKTVELLQNNVEFREEDAFNIFAFISSDELTKDMLHTSFKSSLEKSYHPAYLHAFSALFRHQTTSCSYGDVKISDKLSHLISNHLYGHPFELCQFKQTDFFGPLADLALSYSKKIILKKIPYKMEEGSIRVFYELPAKNPSNPPRNQREELKWERDFYFNSQTNEIILQTQRIPKRGKIIVIYEATSPPPAP